jgi:predicted DNA-binding WGR domain protein/uncharacterized protein YwqG
MNTETWYLELSEDNGSHKFYEVTLTDATLTIRHGRIGDAGQSSSKTFETADKARAEAEKKLGEKRKKGYADAVVGASEKRSIKRFRTMELEEIEAAFEPWRQKYGRSTWMPKTDFEDSGPRDSKFAGSPWLAHGEAHPNCGCCGKPLQLLLQLNLEQIPDALIGRFGDGLIQVFYCINEDCDVQVINGVFIYGAGVPAFQAFSERHFLRLVSKSELEGAVAQGDLPQSEFPEKRIFGWIEETDYPDGNEWESFGIQTNVESGQDFQARIEIECAEFDLFISTRFMSPDEEVEFEDTIGSAWGDDKIAGYPAWFQQAEYPNCPICNNKMDFVFQIDSGDNVPYTFGRGGGRHVTQCATHKEVLALARS